MNYLSCWKLLICGSFFLFFFSFTTAYPTFFISAFLCLAQESFIFIQKAALLLFQILLLTLWERWCWSFWTSKAFAVESTDNVHTEGLLVLFPFTNRKGGRERKAGSCWKDGMVARCPKPCFCLYRTSACCRFASLLPWCLFRFRVQLMMSSKLYLQF